VALKLSPREISLQLANSTLTRADCALLRPLAQKTTLPINELVSPVPCHRVVVSSPAKGENANDLGDIPTSEECAQGIGNAVPLPSLRVNNSNEGACEDVTAVGSAVPVVPNTPPPAYVRKKEFSLKCNIMALCEAYPIGHIGFFTLTYSDNQQSFRDAAKDFNSLATGVLNDRFLAWVKVGERTKKGVVHFHLLVVCKQEIRRGFDFDAVKNRNYQSASAYIRNEWAFWSSRAARGKKPARVGAAERYGFGGRVELLPIRKNAEALASYLSKYLSKGFVNRRQDDKGVRLISYSKTFPRRCGSRFSFVGGKVKEWRLRCRLFLGHLYFRYYNQALLEGIPPPEPFTYADMPSLFGKRWAWRLRDKILSPMFFNPFY
jgi:hypothetical protein